MDDRVVQYPNRYTLTDNGDGTYTITPAPGTITAAGTPLNKANLFDATGATRYAVTTPAAAFNAITKAWEITCPLSGWSSATTNGYYTNQVTVSGMKAVYNPVWYLNDHTSTTVAASQENFAKIIDMVTYDGYVIFRALEKPGADVLIGIKGV